jgi:GTP diphosphokinase / guanosine-3',5'-bis(diphosphate) 3'-diphosphatase
MKIGGGIITLENIKKILRKNTKNKWIRYWELTYSKSIQRSKKQNDQPKQLLHLIWRSR